MFSRNGNNNGNGAHNAASVASRNGNGHKPESAIPGEHDLLWDGLPPAVTQKLGETIDPNIVSQRRGRGGKTFDYLEGHVVIEQANRIFGFGGWGHELVGDVTLRQVETVDPETGELKTVSGYTAPVRVTVAGAPPRTDIGVHPVTEETFDEVLGRLEGGTWFTRGPYGARGEGRALFMIDPDGNETEVNTRYLYGKPKR